MSTTLQTYEALRAMKGRGTPTLPTDLVVGNVIRVDGMKWRVMEAPIVAETGSVAVESYNEDNQFETLFLSASTPVKKIGDLP